MGLSFRDFFSMIHKIKSTIIFIPGLLTKEKVIFRDGALDYRDRSHGILEPCFVFSEIYHFRWWSIHSFPNINTKSEMLIVSMWNPQSSICLFSDATYGTMTRFYLSLFVFVSSAARSGSKCRGSSTILNHIGVHLLLAQNQADARTNERTILCHPFGTIIFVTEGIKWTILIFFSIFATWW